MRKVKKKLKMSKFEKLLYSFAFLLGITSPISIVFSQATLAQINYEVEQQKKKISEQTKTNESLSMAIDELASLTKIEQVAAEQGLSYNNDNIKNIDETTQNENNN